ncbi:cutinase gene palindrome-binding protein [Xylariales sp. AK1849]|nr:cutinase gene palindrome-binding protein [Xylariales sp. AK1849]
MASQAETEMMGFLESPMFSSGDGGAMVVDDFDMMGMQQSQQQMFPPASSAPNIQTAMAQSADSTPRFSNNAEDSPAAPSPAQANNPPGGNTLTEFTKRRNWPAKVVEELKDFLQIMDAHGRIKYVSPSVTNVTGYQSEEITESFLKDLIHPDDVGTFTSEMNESIATGNPLRMFYRLKKKDGNYAIFESVGHAHIASAKFAPNPENQTPFCQAVFVMSRPYPTRNASLLDSFLEHKIENERLRRRIAELRREEEEEEASQQSWLQGQDASTTDLTPSEDMQSQTGTPYYNSQHTNTTSMPPPERPSSLNMTLTRENLEGATAGNRPDSIRDKMARFEAASHTDTIEMLTGLRYVEGERSHGITTGNHSPALIKGDAGIAIPVDRDPRTGEKKKKLKVAEEYVCTDCGTLDSPEWRKGPSGPKTLCNACGLRWAKKEKKKNNNNNAGGAGTAHQTGSSTMVDS